MKYIVLADGDNEFMFILSRNQILTHEIFSDAVRGYKYPTGGLGWERRFRLQDTVSAGFIDREGQTYGESVSLRLQSRPEDQQLYDDMWNT